MTAPTVLPPPSSPDASPFAEPGTSAGEKTRAALLRSALDLFGRKGYDATSTRDIAGAAGVNIAGIAYHFGGKAGLHRACAEAVAAFIAERLGELAVTDSAADERLDADAAAAIFEELFAAIARFMLARPEAESIARFMVREQMDPSPTFEVLYEALIRPRHERMCRLWARATGDEPTSERVVITVSALFGQIMFFRVGRATALRRLGWATIDTDNVETIVVRILVAIRATLAASRREAVAS